MHRDRLIKKAKKDISKEEQMLFEKNKIERAKSNLTIAEFLTFFLLPLLTYNRSYNFDKFDDTELQRFRKFGFYEKEKQANKVKVLGFIFYLVIILLLINFYEI